MVQLRTAITVDGRLQFLYQYLKSHEAPAVLLALYYVDPYHSGGCSSARHVYITLEGRGWTRFLVLFVGVFWRYLFLVYDPRHRCSKIEA